MGRDYLVHYNGWNTRYDEWITEARIAEKVTGPSRATRPQYAKVRDHTLHVCILGFVKSSVCVCVCVRVRERERKRERYRDRDRERERFSPSACNLRCIITMLT